MNDLDALAVAERAQQLYRNDPGALVALIRDIEHERRSLDLETRAVVLAMRMAGFPWSQIGAALGVSKQAAQQRYGD